MLYVMKFGIFEIDFDMQDNSKELEKWQDYDDIKTKDLPLSIVFINLQEIKENKFYFKKPIEYIDWTNLHFDEEKNTEELGISAESGIIMEASSGKVLYEKEADKELPPASVTKIMTLLLIFDALESGQIHLEDEVTTSEFAASMGGSQVFLEPGEKKTVDFSIDQKEFSYYDENMEIVCSQMKLRISIGNSSDHEWGNSVIFV